MEYADSQQHLILSLMEVPVLPSLVMEFHASGLVHVKAALMTTVISVPIASA